MVRPGRGLVAYQYRKSAGKIQIYKKMMTFKKKAKKESEALAHAIRKIQKDDQMKSTNGPTKDVKTARARPK